MRTGQKNAFGKSPDIRRLSERIPIETAGHNLQQKMMAVGTEQKQNKENLKNYAYRVAFVSAEGIQDLRHSQSHLLLNKLAGQPYDGKQAIRDDAQTQTIQSFLSQQRQTHQRLKACRLGGAGQKGAEEDAKDYSNGRLGLLRQNPPAENGSGEEKGAQTGYHHEKTENFTGQPIHDYWP